MKLTAIRSIKRKHYKGKVFDLTVDEDHSYNIGGTIVHNSLCTTRIQTGHGLPSITSIHDVVEALSEGGYSNIPVIADGGLRSSGDIAKALAVGASSVMLGSLIAGTKETPTPYVDKGNDGLWKAYRGSASLATKQAHGMKGNHVEGESTLVRDKGGVKYIVEKLNDGLRSALSYTGVRTIEEFQERSTLVRVTPAGQVEARPHLLG